MATINQVLLVVPTVMPTADAVLYTTPTLSTTKLTRVVFSNTDMAAVHTITCNITNGASTTSNQIINGRQLAPGETYVSPELAGAVLPSGYELRGMSDSNNVTVMASGIVIQGQ